MSYGRTPHYIYEMSDGTYVFHDENGSVSYVSRSALAQFVARLAARPTNEFADLIAEGVALDPTAFSENFAVEVTGGWAHIENGAT